MLIIKIDDDIQHLLTKVAAISGIPSINAFILNAATEKAKCVIERENTLSLSQADALLLMEVLDRPTMVLGKIKAVAKRYKNPCYVKKTAL